VSDQTLIILRICLLALVYLTFFRVLRAVWVELRAESPRPALVPVALPLASPVPVSTHGARPVPVPATSSPRGARLVVVAPPVMAGTAFELSVETTIGRAAGCGVVIDDARVSKVHARLFDVAATWMVEDLGSTNGTMLNGDLLKQAQPVRSGDHVQVGDVVLELS
jgi:hypothetical protein